MNIALHRATSGMSDAEATSSASCRHLLAAESATATVSPLSSSSSQRGDADRQLQQDGDTHTSHHSGTIGHTAVIHHSREAWLARLVPSRLLALWPLIVSLLHRILGARPEPTEAPPGPAHRCCTDGLHVVFSFLPLRDVSLAARTCRRWTAAAATMTSRPGSCQTVQTRQQIELMANSTMVRHVTSMATRCLLRDIVDGVSLLHLPLCRRLPCLTELRLEVGMDDYRRDTIDVLAGETPLFQLPSTLRQLMVFTRHDGDWHAVDAVLARLCHADTPPIRQLCILFDGRSRRGVDCQIPAATLRRLLCLRESLVEFEVLYQSHSNFFADEDTMVAPSGRWTQEHIDVFRQMTLLEASYPFGARDRWSDEELIMLAEEPVPTHLHNLRLVFPPATAAGREALVRLPLTQMTLLLNASDDLSFLGRMPALENLTLRVSVGSHVDVALEALSDTLAQCTQLTTLQLSTKSLTHAQICPLLRSLPKLRQLTLDDAGSGLAFASTVKHLANTLETFALCCPSVSTPPTVSIEQLQHLCALQNLRTMTLSVTFTAATTPDAITKTVEEFSSDKPTFRRDRWPHMQSSQLNVIPAP